MQYSLITPSFAALFSSLVLCLTPQPAFAQNSYKGGNVNASSYQSSDLPTLQRFRSAGATAVRLYIFNDDADTDSEAQYRDWLQNIGMPQIDNGIDLVVNQLGMRALISIHTPPGGRTETNPPVDRALQPSSTNDWMRTVLIEAWTQIAAKYNSLGDQVMYQLFSEPAPPSGNNSTWDTLQANLISAIRTADSTPVANQPRIYFMTSFGNPLRTNTVNLSAKNGKMGVLANMYFPFNYTHQKTNAVKNKKAIKYPGCVKKGKKGKGAKKKNNKCNKAGIRKSLRKFDRFAKKNDLEKLIAETSVSRQAPGSPKYLRDIFSTFKKLDIGWFYFTFTERGDSPWRLDCTDNSKDTCIPTSLNSPSKRQQQVERWLGR